MSDFKPKGIPMRYIPELSPDYRSNEDGERVNQMFDALRKKQHSPVYENYLAKRKEELLKYIEESGLTIGEFYDNVLNPIIEANEQQLYYNTIKWIIGMYPKFTFTNDNINIEHINTEHHESDN